MSEKYSLEGLTVNALGDSYFAGFTLGSERVWVQLMANKYNWNFANHGVNGGVVADNDPYEGDVPMCFRYATLPDNNPDIVLVNGGRNDYNKCTPMASESGNDTKYFYDSLKIILSGLRKKYPNSAIICTTVWNFAGENKLGLTSDDYADAMKKAAAQTEGAYCFEANNVEVSGVDTRDPDYRLKYFINATDVSHLNEEGMKKVFPKFDKFITECYADYKSKHN